MQPSPQLDTYLHSKLPIDEDEKILAIFKHHWFAYASSWILGFGVIVLAFGFAIALTSMGGDESSLVQHRDQILGVTGLFSALIVGVTSIPVYLRSQEQLVLTEEALLQVLQPSLFANSVNQLSLQHITDVSVKQDFFGSILGYGHINIETPGEQNNYNFLMLPTPHNAARQIIEAHENFDAALQAGRLPSNMGGAMPQAPQIDPQQYQQFLQYQQMMARHSAEQNNSQEAAQANDPTNPSQNQR
jgi:hypothetical protein